MESMSIMVTVHAANKHDTMSGIFPAMWAVEKYPSIEKISADGGYMAKNQWE